MAASRAAPWRAVLAAALYLALLGPSAASPEAEDAGGGATFPAEDQGRVLVLGAGASGIAAAARLWEGGVRELLVLEGGDDLGGRMKSEEIGGRRVELGPNWVQGANASNWLARLVRDYGIRCNTTDWDSWSFFDAHGPTSRLTSEDNDLTLAKMQQGQGQNQTTADVSVAAAARLLGWHPQNEYDDALDLAQFDFENAAPPSAVSSRHTYPIRSYVDFGDSECFVNDQRGWKHLLRMMAERAGFRDRIQFNQRVRSITQDAGGVTVETQDARYRAEHVIVTFSVGVLQSGSVHFQPSMPSWKTDAIEKYGMGHFAKVFFEFERRFWPDREFFQFVSPMRGHYAVWQNMNYQQEFKRPPFVLMLIVMGDNALKVQRQPENRTAAEALEVLRAMFPGEEVPAPRSVLLHRWSEDPLFAGSYSYWPVGATPEDKANLCAPVGRVWFAGEACHERYAPFVHGALLSGNATGEAVAQCSLRKPSCALAGAVAQRPQGRRSPPNSRGTQHDGDTAGDAGGARRLRGQETGVRGELEVLAAAPSGLQRGLGISAVGLLGLFALAGARGCS